MQKKVIISLPAAVTLLVFSTLTFSSSYPGSAQVNQTAKYVEDRHPSWSPDGSRIAFDSSRDGNWEIYIMNADGSGQRRLTDNSDRDQHPAWSPDGTKIAFETDRDGDLEIYVMDTDGSGQTNLTDNAVGDWAPSWSPDGTRIAFESYRHGSGDIYVMNADGSGQTNLTNHPSEAFACSWSPDGSRIAFNSDRDGNVEIYLMNADGSGQTRLTTDPAYDGLPSWSPDGEKIVFTSNRDGNVEIYLMHADGSGQTRLTDNTDKDGYPAWSPDGAKILYDSERDACLNIFVMSADGLNSTNLTDNTPPITYNRPLTPLPQSELNLQEIPFRIVFESYRITEGKENWEICLINADGTNLTNLTNTPDVDEFYPHVSPDGTRICFVTFEGEGLADKIRNVYYMNIDGTGRTKIAENAYQPCWSGDGKRIAYLPGEFSRFNPNSAANKGLEIYNLETEEVIRHPGENIQHLFCLCWSPDGEWFTARSRHGRNIAFKSDASSRLVLSIGGCRPDISPDGGRITWGSEDEELRIGTLDFSSTEKNVVDQMPVVQCNRGFKVYHVDWSPDGKYLTFSYGLDEGSEEVGQRARGWNLCICDLSTLKWTSITTDGKDYKEPDWVPLSSSWR